MTKLFITGATGYVGGDALYAIANAYPDLDIIALVRNSDKGAKVAAQFPKIKLVFGDLSSTDLLTSEASKADIVLHLADSDNVDAAKAIVAGLLQKQTPGYFIHISGTGIVGTPDFMRKTFGVKDEKTYDDWDSIDEVTSLPDDYLHRNVDKVVLEASKDNPGKIITAIVCPPTIYGPSRTTGNNRSIQAFWMAEAVLNRGKGFQVGEGKNLWTQIHVQDLSNVFLALVTAALQGDASKATWNDKGYYFVDNGPEFAWGDVAKAIAKAAADKKLIKSADIDSLDGDEVTKLHPFGPFLWGTNARAKAIRAGKLLGWAPKQKGLLDFVPEIVDQEAKALGLVKGHAEKAAA
ncbi:NAD(P)-binding protein [Trematosphaeria pertusa]|uniref:NAD(P)-binding protein n=1 Tax=Trematosphaeria pertusa TaxID=390896 RepID=A0A6A6IUK8_9PLEO|nr:NAD(P)-binding protein [Trematosphaeria pertusa]KAF2254099.1 NAD(P)-binding protein [Trematosphaeria pertusa]